MKCFFGALAVLLLATSTYAQLNATYATLGEALTDPANQLATLSRLLNTTSSPLAEVLTSPDFQGIIFAPTDDAFAALNDTLNGTLNEVSPEIINQLLQYHVIPANTDFPTLDTTQRAAIETALTGVDASAITASLTVVPDPTDVAPEAAYLAGLPGAVGNAVLDPAKNTTAAKATIYLIDQVLVFPSNPSLITNETYPLTVPAAVQANDQLSFFLQAVSADQEVLALLSGPNAAYTIFAPTDDAFTALMQSMNLTPDKMAGLIGSLEVNALLKTHVLAAPPTVSSALPDQQAVNVTTLAGDDVVIERNGDNVTVTGPSGSQSAVVTADVMAGKSVIHVVDAVILTSQLPSAPPASPSPSTSPVPDPTPIPSTPVPSTPTPSNPTPSSPNPATPPIVARDSATSATFSAVVAGVLMVTALFAM